MSKLSFHKRLQLFSPELWDPPGLQQKLRGQAILGHRRGWRGSDARLITQLLWTLCFDLRTAVMSWAGDRQPPADSDGMGFITVKCCQPEARSAKWPSQVPLGAEEVQELHEA